MKIKLKSSKWSDDWYTIVRAEHDGHQWWESDWHNRKRFMTSERLSPEACIEGDANEMLAVAKAIKKRSPVSFKRVAVHFEPDGVHFCSPRNSDHDAVVSIAEADELADQILAELG